MLENCTGFYLFSPSGMDSQNWGYCGKDAASSSHPPGWKISTTFLGNILYPQAAVVLLALVWGHRLPMGDGLQFSLKGNLYPALILTQWERAQLKHWWCSSILFVVVHLPKGLFKVAQSVLPCSCPFRSTLGSGVFSPSPGECIQLCTCSRPTTLQENKSWKTSLA